MDWANRTSLLVSVRTALPASSNWRTEFLPRYSPGLWTETEPCHRAGLPWRQMVSWCWTPYLLTFGVCQGVFDRGVPGLALLAGAGAYCP